MPKDYFSQLSAPLSPPVYRYFNGINWRDSQSGKLVDIISPVDGLVLGKIPTVLLSEIDEAVSQAKLAQQEWMRVPVTKRARVLHLAADWIRHHQHFLSILLTKEIGKCEAEAKEEIIKSAEVIDYIASQAINLHGEELSADAFPGYDQSKTAIINKVPLGLVLAISPFSQPIYLSILKIAPALVTGNAVIFKPAMMGAISALHLTEIFRISGLPDGLLSTVTGSGEDIGHYLTTHPQINLINFTGSSQTGEKIAKGTGMVSLLMECAGNNPAIVLPDASMEETAREIVKGAFSYSGQRCTAIKYILGLTPTLEKLLPYVIRRAEDSIKMGDPRNPANNLGPLISDEAAFQIEKRILEAVAMGARIALGGTKEGRYVQATILTNVRPSMEIIYKETYGPVVSFVSVKSIDEAIGIINDSVYGLQASIFTSDEGAGINLVKQINVGTVQINSKPERGPDHFPFLGVKKSGTGVQGIKYVLEAMVRPKVTVLEKPH